MRGVHLESRLEIFFVKQICAAAIHITCKNKTRRDLKTRLPSADSLISQNGRKGFPTPAVAQIANDGILNAEVSHIVVQSVFQVLGPEKLILRSNLKYITERIES